MCVYRTDKGICRKLTDDYCTSYCVDGPCEYEVQSRGDKIRNMTDKQMSYELVDMFEELFEDGIPSREYLENWFSSADVEYGDN